MKIIKDNKVVIVSVYVYGMLGVNAISRNGYYVESYSPINKPFLSDYINNPKDHLRELEIIEYALFGLNKDLQVLPTKNNPSDTKKKFWAGVNIYFEMNNKPCFIDVYPPQWVIINGVKKFQKENITISYDNKFYFRQSRRQLLKFVTDVLGISK